MKAVEPRSTIETDVPRRSALEEFVTDFRDFWQRMPSKGLFVSIFVIWVCLFHFFGNSTLGYTNTRSLFGWLQYAYRTADDEHGLIMPVVVLALFWWKRDELLAVPKSPWWPPVLLVGFGLVLHLAGYVVQQTRLSVAGFFIGLYGLMGMVWGRGWLRASFFPMILLVFCIPMSTLAEVITFPLRLIVTEVSVGFSRHLLGIDVFRNGSQIFNSQGLAMYDVAPACSGIRSLVTLFALTMIYGFISFTANWKRLLMLVVAIPIAILGNIARVTTVILVGEAFGKDAGVMIEQKFGFITFAVAIGCVFLIGYVLQDKDQRTVTITPDTA